MNISLITPAAKRSLTGNRMTAMRWARLLGELGHRVTVSERWRAGPPCDLLVAIHAYRSAGSVERFRERHPRSPIVVLLAGTDVYRYQATHPKTTHGAMVRADRLVGLHDTVAADVPERFRGRVRVIHQSARPLASGRRPGRRHFDVCVVGHLREEKDPLRAAAAARALPASSRVRVVHLGKAYDAAWQAAAEAEAAANPRYLWKGEVPRWRVREHYARARLMVVSSRMEGGANVVSEAVVAGVPVVASDVAGNRGLLGDGHPGYYPVGDTRALARLLLRAEAEPAFLDAVARSGNARRALFEPGRERAAWAALLEELRSAR